MKGTGIASMAVMPEVMLGALWFGLWQYPGYLVSDKGQVVSELKAPRVLKPIRMGEYRGLQLRMRDGSLGKVYLHRLVCEAFNGPPMPGQVCRHLDGDKTNNDFTNLAWGTQAENVADQVRHGTTCSGERNGNAKLTRADVAAMRAERDKANTPYHAIAKKYGVSTMTAHRAITGKSWR